MLLVPPKSEVLLAYAWDNGGGGAASRHALCLRILLTPNLSKSRSSKSNCKHWEDPGVCFGEVSKNRKRNRPNADKESKCEQEDLPFVDVLAAEEECPVPTVRC